MVVVAVHTDLIAPYICWDYGLATADPRAGPVDNIINSLAQ